MRQDKDIHEPQLLKRIKPNPEDVRFPQDANDEMFMKSSDEDVPKKDEFPSSRENSSSSSNDDDDDDEELLREFQKIKE